MVYRCVEACCLLLCEVNLLVAAVSDLVYNETVRFVCPGKHTTSSSLRVVNDPLLRTIRVENSNNWCLVSRAQCLPRVDSEGPGNSV